MSKAAGRVKILTTIADAQTQPHAKRRVLVPTMGALHKAHGELIRVAREAAGENGEVAVSIFVNPLQFEPGSDYGELSASGKSRRRILPKCGGQSIISSVCRAGLRNRPLDIRRGGDFVYGPLEGKSRPGHFRGVCTVVAKLFNILAPDAAVFGEKDFQQLAVVRRMVRDLNFKIDIIAVPTVREEDGLACSSRNQYLNPEERKQATVLFEALMAAKNAGKKSANNVVALAQRVIKEAPPGKNRLRRGRRRRNVEAGRNGWGELSAPIGGVFRQHSFDRQRAVGVKLMEITTK